jgi:hypothetical protein
LHSLFVVDLAALAVDPVVVVVDIIVVDIIVVVVLLFPVQVFLDASDACHVVGEQTLLAALNRRILQ